MNSRTPRHICTLLLCAAASTLAGGCAELVAEGHISDRDTSAPIPEVQILQSSSGETWRPLGRTDGVGAYWVLKSKIKAGSRIRFSKPGYFPMDMLDTEFVTSSSHLMTPTGELPQGHGSNPEGDSDSLDTP